MNQWNGPSRRAADAVVGQGWSSSPVTKRPGAWPGLRMDAWAEFTRRDPADLSRSCATERRTACRSAGAERGLLDRSGDQSLPDRLLARELARAAYRLGLFSCGFLRRLLIKPTTLHLPEDAFALHLLLQDTERLIDIVVSDEHLQRFDPSRFEQVQVGRGAHQRRAEEIGCREEFRPLAQLKWMQQRPDRDRSRRSRSFARFARAARIELALCRQSRRDGALCRERKRHVSQPLAPVRLGQYGACKAQ